jgi:tetratricopeptide (TPR) repeat protein
VNARSPDKKLNEARELSANYHFPQALALLKKLSQQYPHRAQVWYEYGCAAAGAAEMELAGQAWNKAVEIEPHKCQAMLKIGKHCQRLRLPERAMVWFDKAIAADPRDIPSRIAMATFLEQNHRLAEAREMITACRAIDPKDDQARYYAAFLDRRENKLEQAERRLRELIQSNPQQQYVKYSCRYELAEVLNRTERFDEAMEMLEEAKKIVRDMGDINAMLAEYDQAASQYRRSTEELPRNILRTWAREFPERSREPLPKMAFLGGHPRSGTTLIEQVLGAHSEVAALDEPRALTKMVGQLYSSSPQISPARLNVIRRSYRDAIEREWGGSLQGKLLLDKNPSPTTKLRIWLRVFPEWRVLIALRDPRDVVVSCYFQNFPFNPYNANFLILERTARHYADLMDIWLAVRQWEGLTWMETRYEDVVADLEKEGRRVTEFLGLEWQPAQTQFHEQSSKKQMYSPTYRDASQPVYARSVARWQAYQKHLEPILPILEPYCQALGYV